MRILGTEPSSVILSEISGLKKCKVMPPPPQKKQKKT